VDVNNKRARSPKTQPEDNSTMAAFLQPADPWIENSFVHAISFQSDSDDHAADASQEQLQQQSESQWQESQWGQTESTIPSGLLPSQPRATTTDFEYQVVVPSRQAKIIQIIYRGGHGWDGSSVHSCASDANNCPPYVILHDGEFSTVAFLSTEAMRSIGMNVNDNAGAQKLSTAATNQGYESGSSASSLRAERASRRAQRNNNTAKKSSNIQIQRRLAAQRITLRGKCLASINHYTISTISQCLSYNSHHITSVLNSLDIPHDHHKQLSPLKQFMMCIYVTGSITVIGGENGGLIGESYDVHCSVKVRRALRDFVGQCDDDDDAYNRLVERLEEVHLYYQNEARDKLLRDNEGTVRKSSFVRDWPWTSRLQKHGAVDTGGATGDAIEQGNVTSLLNNDDELDAVLGDISEGEGNDEVVGRASTGTVFAQWNIDGRHEGAAEKRKNNSNDDNQGNVEEMFNNYEHLEDVIEFTEDPALSNNSDSQVEQNTPVRAMAKSDAAREQARDALKSPGNAVPFIGIDQMIASQSQDSEDDSDDEFSHQLLTQAETFETAAEEMIDSEPTNDHDNGSTTKYFSANENEPSDNDVNESQFPTRAIKRPPTKKTNPKSKRSRHSQILIESQFQLPTMAKRKKPSDDESVHKNTPKTNNSKTKPYSLDSDDSDAWMKLKAKPKRKSQMAGEGSEENSPVDTDAHVEFDCDQDELVDTEDEKEKSHEMQPDPAAVDEGTQGAEVEEQPQDLATQHDANQCEEVGQGNITTPDSTSNAKPPKRVVREFDYHRVLMRAKRLSGK
jgi:hypothetical protein